MPVLVAASLGAAASANVGAQPSSEPVWATFDEAGRAYNDAIARGVAIEDSVAELKTDTRGSEAERAGRLYLASMLQWRHGDREGALASVRAALEFGRYGELLRHQGRLLDALGNAEQAARAYREAVPLLSGEMRNDTELRLALLIAEDGRDAQALLSLAERGDGVFRERIAMLLAVLGYPEAAIRLYAPASDATDDQGWRYYLRLTEWALQDRNPLQARETAWQAVRLARGEQDRRYTLALLAEAYRLDDALPELVEELEAEKNLGDEARALWASLLRETNRPDDALTMLQGRAEKEPPAVKRQLVGLYRESGRSAEMIAELERLMSTDGNETIWPQGLAGFYLERGDRPAARAVWQDFVDRSTAPAALLFGAELMKKLNFEELALSAAEKAQRVSSSPGQAALFRFELHLERSRRDRAAEVLAALDSAVDAGDPVRKTIAMSYERLGRPLQALRVMTAFAGADAGRDAANRQYIAHLLIITGQPEKAVENLLTILEDAAASQRRLVQTRIIAAAAEAGIEGRLTAGLGKKIQDGTATEAEAALLIEMRVRAGEADAALSLVDTLYGEPSARPVQKLKRLAAVHRALGNWRAYDTVLARLAEQDADNAVFHIRGRIINYLDKLRPDSPAGGGDGGFSLRVSGAGQPAAATLPELLRQYSEVSDVGADREFQAGVLAMAGEHRQAATIYREVLAADPSRLDNYLAIGNQLAAMQQEDQAIGMYQYLVEGADRESLSWAALDGIIALKPGVATLKWAQRMVLERLAAKPDVFAYYRQLADLSADLGESELQLAALHNGLSAEPELRMSTLRELLRMTATTDATRHLGAAVFGGQALSLNQRHVVFGRRLLALGLQMPPDVYLSLGKAMLEAGDAAAALRALHQAVEYTGSTELLVQAAGMFQRAGDDVSAHRLYYKALLDDPGNVGLMLELAWCSERLGENTRARELFLEGLATLQRRLPQRTEEIRLFTGFKQSPVPPQKSLLDKLLLDEGREAFPLHGNAGRTHSREYQQYYVPLRNGLLRMLSVDSRQREAVLTRLLNEYRATLTELHSPGPVLPRLANYPRLERQAQLLRYLSYAFGDYAAVNETDETLLTLLPEDPLLPEILAAHRVEWGSLGYRDWLQTSTALTERQKLELKRLWLASVSVIGDGLPAIRTDISERTVAGDRFAGTVSLTPQQKAWKRELHLAIREESAAGILQAAKKLVATRLIWDTLHEVEPYLSAAGKRDLAQHVIPMLRSKPNEAANSLRIAGGSLRDLAGRPRPWAAKLLEWSGDAVLDERRILELVSVPEDEQAGNAQLGPFDVWFVYHTLSADSRRRWLEQLLQRRLSSESRVVLTLVSLLLQVKQDPATSDLLRWVMREHEGYFEPAMLRLDEIDVHAGNVPLARELVAIARKRHAKAFSERMPDPVFEPNLLRCEGKIDEALNKLLDIYFDGELPSETSGTNGGRDAIGFVSRYYHRLVAGNELRLIEILNGRNLRSAEAEKTAQAVAGISASRSAGRSSGRVA